MPLETLSPEIEAFFTSGGEIPDALAGEVTQTVEEVVPAAPPAQEVVEGLDTPPTPAAPSADVARLQRLIEQQQETLKALQEDARNRADADAARNAPKAPDPETDPLGHLNHQLKTIQDQIKAFQESQDTRAKETEQQRTAREFVDNVNAQIKAFKATTPDYDAAYSHMVKMKQQDYMDIGLDADSALTRVRQDEMQMAVNAANSGKNPAEVVYAMAKRYGYVKAAEKQESSAKLKTIKEGMKAEQQVQRETPPAGELDLESLKNASSSDLDKFVRGDGWEKLSGRSTSIFG